MKLVAFFYPNFNKYNSLTEEAPKSPMPSRYSLEVCKFDKKLNRLVFEGSTYVSTFDVFRSTMDYTSNYDRFFKNVYALSETLNHPSIKANLALDLNTTDILNLSYKINEGNCRNSDLR